MVSWMPQEAAGIISDDQNGTSKKKVFLNDNN
jgi:hypothetical protein